MRERQEGRYYGLGITIAVVDGDITVVVALRRLASLSEGPSARRRHREDRRRRDEGLDERRARCRSCAARKGTPVKIVAQAQRLRPADRPSQSSRDEIHIPTVPAAFMLDAQTGYVQLSRFRREHRPGARAGAARADSAGDEAAAVRPAQQPGRRARPGHQGGQPFLPRGDMIVYTRGRVPNSDQDYRATEASDYLNVPMVMLANRSSASASEIVSGALQDHDRSLIVGETTFGKALVQSVYRVSEGAGVALTTAHYYTPSGRLIQRPWDDSFDEYLTYTMRDQDREQGAQRRAI